MKNCMHCHIITRYTPQCSSAIFLPLLSYTNLANRQFHITCNVHVHEKTLLDVQTLVTFVATPLDKSYPSARIHYKHCTEHVIRKSNASMHIHRNQTLFSNKTIIKHHNILVMCKKNVHCYLQLRQSDAVQEDQWLSSVHRTRRKNAHPFPFF